MSDESVNAEGMAAASETPTAQAVASPSPNRGRLAVLHVVDSLEYGGLERVVTDLAIRQKAQGDRVAVFSLVDTDGHRRTLEAAGVSVIQGGKRIGFDRAAVGRLRSAIRAHRAEIVHSHNFVPNYHAAFALIGLRHGPRHGEPGGITRPALVTTCHDMGFRLDNRKLRLLFRASLLRTGRVAMVSRQVEAGFSARGIVSAACARVVLNGIPVERFTPITDASPEARLAARAALGLPDTLPLATPVIGAVGRLVDLKNHRALISAMPALLRDHPALHLVIIGGGPLKEALQAQATAAGLAKHVHLAGERDDIASLLKAFDLFALPSTTEGLSIALLEAFASGLAVVAGAVGGNPDIVSDGETGLLYDAEPALGPALERLLADVPLRNRLGTQARQWVQAHGSIDAACDAYDRLYREVLGIDRLSAKVPALRSRTT